MRERRSVVCRARRPAAQGPSWPSVYVCARCVALLSFRVARFRGVDEQERACVHERGWRRTSPRLIGFSCVQCFLRTVLLSKLSPSHLSSSAQHHRHSGAPHLELLLRPAPNGPLALDDLPLPLLQINRHQRRPYDVRVSAHDGSCNGYDRDEQGYDPEGREGAAVG